MKSNKNDTLLYLALLSLIVLSIGLAGCGAVEFGVTQAGGEEGGIEVGIEPTPTPQMLNYANSVYGFKFEYPETWTLSEIDHGVILMKGTNRLGIHFRWLNESFNFGQMGMAAGTPIYSDQVYFFGQPNPEYIVEIDNLSKYILFGETGRIDIDDLVFFIVLEDLESDYMTLDIPDEIIAEAKTILGTFERIEATGSNPLVAPTQEPTLAIQEAPPVDISSVYENLEYGFSFHFSPYMTVVEEPNKVLVRDEMNGQMTIAYRRADEDIQLTDFGELSGQLHPYTEFAFLGSPIQTVLNIQDDLIVGAYFGGPGAELGEGTPLRFIISMQNVEGGRLANAQVDMMIQVLQSLELIQ
ncbi:MAG: hypothetical protein PVF83_10225 [Anaerolineales bacterium]|jgi:hypothetical protein